MSERLSEALLRVVELPVVVVSVLLVTIGCMGIIIFVSVGGLRRGHGHR